MKSHDELLSLLRSAAGDGAVGEDRGFSAESLKASLPAATFSAFEFDAALLFGSRVVFARPVSDMKPSALAGQLRRVRQACGCEAACLLDAPAPYLKKRLMEEGVGFVTARGEFFLPELLHLKPEREGNATPLATELNATGKSVFLHLLYAEGGSTVSDMAQRLSLSRAGVQRACEDLLARELVTRSTGGPTRRTAIYERIGAAEYFEAGWVAFGPAARRVRAVPLEAAEGLPACGLSALASLTMLNPPDTPELAVHLKREGELGDAAPAEDGRMALVHVLPYDPAPFASDGVVDPFTMLKTVSRHDERIDMAIEEIKEGMGWPM